MIPRSRHFPSFRSLYKLCKTASSFAVWILMMSLIVMFPLLFVFTVPVLTAYQSTPSIINTKKSLHPEGIAQSPQPDIRKIVHSSQSSPVPSQYSSFQHPHDLDITKGEIYLILDTSQHRLFVKQEDRVLYTAIASTGKGTVLIDPQNPNRRWIFETPKGSFNILQKLKNPVWIRPDWAFIEQGEPIPDQMSDRLKIGVLGAYALGFGDGYFIHGALYTNLLGQEVTHGCIQLHPDALQYVFDIVRLGTPLIII